MTQPIPAAVHPLATVRARRGWSYQQCARMIAMHAHQFGVHNLAAGRQKVWRWEHRGVKPDRVSQRALAAALDIDPYDVERYPWPTWLAPAEVDPALAELAWLRARDQIVRAFIGEFPGSPLRRDLADRLDTVDKETGRG
jgi:transcriptional regulator with XRE-family HTH domain